MKEQILNNFILIIILAGNGLGSILIIRKNPYRYGFVYTISILTSIFLCLLFYWLGFYRFDLPLLLVLPAVAVSFSFLALIGIRYRPERHTFPFFFVLITAVFSIEVILKRYTGFIVFRSGWDYWDSYSLYWIYLRFFDFFGEFFVPLKYRTPLDSRSKTYWSFFIIVGIYGVFGFIYLSRY